MAFVFGLMSFVLGAVLVAVCLVAIPGPAALDQDHKPAPGH